MLSKTLILLLVLIDHLEWSVLHLNLKYYIKFITKFFISFVVEMAAMGLGNPFMQNPFLQNLTSLLYNPNAAPWNSQLSNKAVASMWMNNDAKMQHEEEEVDDEELGVAETYADYMPSKLKLGKKHPDPVVETASLSSVQPADVWFVFF